VKHKDVKEIEITTPFRGYNCVRSFLLKYRLFDGSWSQDIEREVFERGHGVVVILFDPFLDKLVFVEQFRHGAYAALSSPWFGSSFSPWTMEFVAGNLMNGEKPETVAIRESREEAGCEIKNLFKVGHYLISPSCSSQSVFVFCAQTDASKIGGVHGLKEEGEQTRVVVKPVAKVFELLETGEIMVGGTVIAAQWFKIHYGEIKQKWLQSQNI